MVNINRFLPSIKKAKSGSIQQSKAITLTSVSRESEMTEESRRSYATELYDTYKGFSSKYLEKEIRSSISNTNIRREMLKITRSLPLLQFFINSISRVYSVQPTRKFYIDGKEIIKKPTGDGENNSFNKFLNSDKFYYDDELYNALNDLYNDSVINSIKQAERYTNLFHTTIYKAVTDNFGNIKLVFIPNDTVQVLTSNYDNSKAEQIALVQDSSDIIDNNVVLVPIVENWTKDIKDVPIPKADRDREDLEELKVNQAALEYEKLFGSKESENAFAPFIVFRDDGSTNSFWNLKDDDIVQYCKSLNLSLTELKYLEKFTSFGLKYTVNIKPPTDGVIDPNGFLQLAVANSAVPGVEQGKNFEVGEFKNSGSIDEVIKSIIFNMKMLFSLYNIPLDSLISSNSVRSAENKQMDNDELFASINAQRDIWNLNEQSLFKVLQAVHNRDNLNKIPENVEIIVDYSENKSEEKTAEDWIIEIQNNVSTVLDWLASISPDLNRDELMQLLLSNKEINDSQKKEPLDLNSFAQMDEEGNLIIPEDPNSNQIDKENDDNATN